MVQSNSNSNTVNPAGSPRVTVSKPDPYTREDFMRDLKKVAKKSPPKK